MGTRSKARSWTVMAALGGLGCGDPALDGSAATTGDPLPRLDTGAMESTGEGSTGEPVASDDPRLCAAACPLVLPTRWVYESGPASRPTVPAAHVVPVMLRDPNGMLTVAELRDGKARLHRLDGDGRLQWNVPLPLPCDPCELTDVALHPSGDLLLSATGVSPQGEPRLLAARYDAVIHALVWLTELPLVPIEGVHVRSGGIAALPDDVVAQLYMRGELEFDVLQRTLVIAHGPEGVVLDEETLTYGSATTIRPPLVARATADGTLLVGVFEGSSSHPIGRTERMTPPLWHVAFATVPTALDDIVLAADDHAIELGHTFDGEHVHLLLGERAGAEPQPRWVASLTLPSTTSTPAALALGPDGDVYVAMRTTQAPGDTPEPLVGVSLSRWTPTGELRWHTTLLQAVAETFNPVELAVDDDEALVVAAIVDGRLRVESRAQHCACGA